MGRHGERMVSLTDIDGRGEDRRRSTPPGPPAWTGWLQIGLSTMLAVLFLVMVARTREQNRLLQQLEQRVQGLENSRALERTSVLEEQQRAMLSRLQSLEASGRRLEALEEQQEQWRQALSELRSRTVQRPETVPAPMPSSPLPSAPSQSPRSEGGVLRPPPPVSP